MHDYHPMSRLDRQDIMTTLESTTGGYTRHLCACGCGLHVNIPTDPIRCTCLGCERLVVSVSVDELELLSMMGMRPVNPLDIN